LRIRQPVRMATDNNNNDDNTTNSRSRADINDAALFSQTSNSQTREGDRIFLDSIKDSNKTAILNAVTSHIANIREHTNELQLTNAEFRNALNRANRQFDKLSEENDRLKFDCEQLRTSLATERNRRDYNQTTTDAPNMYNSTIVNDHPVSSPINNTQSTTITKLSSHTKTKRPENFSGEKPNTINDWLIAVKRYMVLEDVCEEKQVAHAATMLTSNALSWWNAIEQANPHKSILDYSWSEFELLAKRRWLPINSEHVALSKMTEWKQAKSVNSYINSFQSFSQSIDNARLDESMRVQLFIKGLKPAIQPFVRLLKPKTLEDAYEAAQSTDASVISTKSDQTISNQSRSFNRNQYQLKQSFNNQQSGTRNNPIHVNNAETQHNYPASTEDGSMSPTDSSQCSYDLNALDVKVSCWYCKKSGHYRDSCPSLAQKNARLQQQQSKN
jgi:Ty3 transposon capsid-like protein